jgi:hypothetical protein
MQAIQTHDKNPHKRPDSLGFRDSNFPCHSVDITYGHPKPPQHTEILFNDVRECPYSMCFQGHFLSSEINGFGFLITA